jgi:hypothetical protein
MTTPEHHIARTARRQHGVFTLDQARAAGFTDAQVRHRVRRGQWERLTRGVFALNGLAPTRERAAMAAVLARPDGAISHLTAAALAGATIPTPIRPSLTVAPSASGRSPIASVHRLSLPADLVTTIEGIRCTTPARTVVDCATVLGPVRHGRLVDDVLHKNLTTAARISELLDLSPHVTLARRRLLAAHLEVWLPAIRPGSAAEARFLRQLDDWGLPPPERQVRITDHHGHVVARVDGGWPDRRLGYEYDSVEWHGPAAWASDEARHRLIEALGWVLVHVDKTDLRPGARSARQRLIAEYNRTAPALARS